MARGRALVEARAWRRREAIARMLEQATGSVAVIEGEAVRMSGPGLLRRWLTDAALRDAGRGGL